MYAQRGLFCDRWFWGLMIATLSLYCVWRLGKGTYQTLLVGVLTMVWGLRLALHIGLRFAKKKTEDPRYAAMSESWNRYYLRCTCRCSYYKAL